MSPTGTPISKKLSAAVPGLPEKVAEASLHVWLLAEQKGSNSLETAILARLLKALKALLRAQSSLDVAAAASSDLEVMLTLLMDPSVLAELRKADPLAPARLRGIKAKQKILDTEGGCITAEEVAEMLGQTGAAISKARKEYRLIGLPVGQNRWIYPSWQFQESGGYLPGLKKVLAELRHFSPWAQIMFLLEANDRLDGKKPLDYLRSGQLECVLLVARQHGEQGAA